MLLFQIFDLRNAYTQTSRKKVWWGSSFNTKMSDVSQIPEISKHWEDDVSDDIEE